MIRRTAGIWLTAFGSALTLAAGSAFAAGNAVPASAHSDNYRQDTGRSGYTQEALVTPLSLVWKHTIKANKTVGPAPVYSNGVIYFGNDTNFYALNEADGAQKWIFAGDGKFNSAPDVAGGFVYIGTEHSELYKLNAETGEQIWAKKLSGPLHTSPLVVGDTVYVGCRDNSCYALSTADATQLWTVQADGPISSPPTYTDDKQVLFASDSSVRCIDSASGRTLWNDRLPQDPTICPPVYSDNSIYVGSSNILYCLLTRSGGARWKAILKSEISTPCAVGHNTIYFVTADNNVTAMDDRGHAVWSSKVDNPTSAAPLLAGKTLIVTTMRGLVYAFDADTGNKIWQYVMPFVSTDTSAKTSFTNINAASTFENGTLYLLSDDGTLSAFQNSAIDRVPPKISKMMPAPGSTSAGTRIPFSAIVQDEGSGIDPSNFTLSVDGKTVPGAAYDPQHNGLHLTPVPGYVADRLPRLEDGTHQATLSARDWRGNVVTQTWGFTVDNSLDPAEVPILKRPDYSTVDVKPDHTPTPSAPALPRPRGNSGGIPPPPPM